ncbi:MAG: site-2 protease family protein, partial [Peptoniphilaceae bacterium]|nr:site-2 protease family protein [Peptoniphilaceae bacterium]MDY5765875.1 site-2 protease family protein [Peptoniphilaceae bacterium]
SLGAVSGPIGVVKTIGEAAKQGAAPLIFFTGYISVNLAFFNLLPIPALDGSKLLFIIIEKLRGKPMNKTWETRITMAGFALLMGLILLVSVKDVLQLF